VRGINKHDRYVDALYTRIKDNYDIVYLHYPLFSSGKAKKKVMVGEIDLVAIKDDEVHVFEVKCSHRIVKAKKQLKRIKRVLSFDNILSLEKITTFFYCGESGLVELVS